MTTTSTPTDQAPLLLDVRDVVKHFPVKGAHSAQGGPSVHAVDGVSLRCRKGETLGLVGESGCGKSTLARCHDRASARNSRTRPVQGPGHHQAQARPHAADPPPHPDGLPGPVRLAESPSEGGIDPRRPLRGPRNCIRRRAQAQGPRADGGGRASAPSISTASRRSSPAVRRQRIGIARALALRPDLIVCDEPVSALDVSIQAQILNLIEDLQVEFGLTYVFIAHDLSVVRHVSNRVAVMYLGRIAEIGPVEEIYGKARHPYTASLLSAVPTVEVARGANEARTGHSRRWRPLFDQPADGLPLPPQVPESPGDL